MMGLGKRKRKIVRGGKAPHLERHGGVREKSFRQGGEKRKSRDRAFSIGGKIQGKKKKKVSAGKRDIAFRIGAASHTPKPNPPTPQPPSEGGRCISHILFWGGRRKRSNPGEQKEKVNFPTLYFPRGTIGIRINKGGRGKGTFFLYPWVEGEVKEKKNPLGKKKCTLLKGVRQE